MSSHSYFVLICRASVLVRILHYGTKRTLARSFYMLSSIVENGYFDLVELNEGAVT